VANVGQIGTNLLVIALFSATSWPAFGQAALPTPSSVGAPIAPPSTQSPSQSPAAINPSAPLGPVAVPAPVIPLDPVRAQMLAKDLADLVTMLAGRWDNELQSFFEPELNVPLAQRHDRIHTIIRPLDNSPFGTNAFYVEYRLGGENGPVARQRIWSLSVDSQLAAIRLLGFSPKNGKSFEGAWRDPAKLTALSPADFDPITGCDVIWRRRADGFSGETRPGACKVVTTDNAQRVLTVTERHDLSATTWDVRDIGVDDRGARVFGSIDNAPTRSRRATPFVCWAGARRGEEAVTAGDLVLHDQGGVATAALAGATPSSVTLRLRNVDWPIGQNRPSLTLYVMTGTDPNAKAYAWGEPDAKRIALDINGTQASCTRDERALWR
jgi:hypothetical protein